METIAQTSLTGNWNFSKMLLKDSVLFNVTDKIRMKNFFLDMTDSSMKEDVNDAEPISQTIDSMVNLISNSFFKINADSTFEISNIELLIPSIPGYTMSDTVIIGKWNFIKGEQILSLHTMIPYVYKFKVIKLNLNTLTVAPFIDEEQPQAFQFEFVRQ
jgi:hypothetical protein